MDFRSKSAGREVAGFRLGEEEQQVANLLSGGQARRELDDYIF